MPTPPPTSEGGANVNQWLQNLIELAKICIIFLGGYFSHWLLIRRDVQGRKREFLSFMEQMIAETENQPAWEDGKFYRDKRPNVMHAAARISEDFSLTDRIEFERLMSVASGLIKAQADNPKDRDGKNDLLTFFHSITSFTKENLPN